MNNKYWNVVAALAGVCIVVYLGVLVYAFATAKIDWAAFRESAKDVVLPVLGYLGALLKQQGAS